MPTKVRKSRRKSGGYDIVEKSTGKIKGHSKTKKNAIKSSRARNMAKRGK